jgi:hypothetical protein
VPVAFIQIAPSGVWADSSTDADTCIGNVRTYGVAPRGGVGDVRMPINPGFAVPSGYSLDVYSAGVAAYVYKA